MKAKDLNIEETPIDAAADMELDAQVVPSEETPSEIETVLVEFIANPIAFNFSNEIGDICEIRKEHFELLAENGIVKLA